MPPAALRDAAPGDALNLARLHRTARAAALPGLREVHSEAEVAHWLATTLMARHAVRVAVVAGQPVGYVGHGLDPRHGPMLLHLYLEPGWWRRGLGSRLLGEALAAHGGRLSLFCIARNTAARRFYEHHGFRVAGSSDGAGTEEGEPDILYVRNAALPHDQHRTGEHA
ncbi:GNAT family N-acetyltransferase [Plastoroseomonas hellenica]|uniref:GNAT family N-acetyltransferase n=1 Tax=Plastoroseomonas hellenica TaxID=2687306 RepID=UPI001BA7E3E8|nr:GNAT family N-acetyltransferase [Plastoroseomonas hellenica]MBR0643480.1 GNAT family N-acetyltransferase [Plastoroseomonas hellenica]